MFDGRLLQARKKSGFTQKQVAEKAGISHSAYSQYENNKAIPPLDIASRICKALNVSMDWLCNGCETVKAENMADVAKMITEINRSIENGGRYESKIYLGLIPVDDARQMRDCVSLVVRSKELNDFIRQDKALYYEATHTTHAVLKKPLFDAYMAWRDEKMSELGGFFFFFDSESDGNAET